MKESMLFQLERCSVSLGALKHCMKERKWHKLAERTQHIHDEMKLLRLALIEHSELNDDLLDQVKYLDIQFRRVQRQLVMHMDAVSADVQTLERGISQANAAKKYLQK